MTIGSRGVIQYLDNVHYEDSRYTFKVFLMNQKDLESTVYILKKSVLLVSRKPCDGEDYGGC